MREIIALTILFLIIGLAFSLGVEIQMPNETGQNSTILSNVKLVGSADKLDLALIVPSGWTLESWNVYGIPKENVNFTYENLNGKRIPHFSMNNLVDEATFSLYFNVKEKGKLESIVTYIKNNNSGFSIASKNLGIKYSTCGNGVCEPGENANNCPVDCSAKKINYFVLIGLSAVILVGIGYWLWKRKYSYMGEFQ